MGQIQVLAASRHLIVAVSLFGTGVSRKLPVGSRLSVCPAGDGSPIDGQSTHDEPTMKPLRSRNIRMEPATLNFSGAANRGIRLRSRLLPIILIAALLPARRRAECRTPASASSAEPSPPIRKPVANRASLLGDLGPCMAEYQGIQICPEPNLSDAGNPHPVSLDGTLPM